MELSAKSKANLLTCRSSLYTITKMATSMHHVILTLRKLFARMPHLFPHAYTPSKKKAKSTIFVLF